MKSPLPRLRPSLLYRKLVVFPAAQLKIARYVFAVACIFMFFHIGIYWLWQRHIEALFTQPESSDLYRVACVVGIWLLEIVWIVAVVFGTNYLTNRIVGPIWRLHQHMNDTLAGKAPGPLGFREGDYFHDVAKTYNELLEKRK